MKSHARFQLDGLVDGFVQVTVHDDGVKHQVKVAPRKMLGLVAQLLKVDDKTSTVTMPVKDTFMPFKITRTDAHQFALQIAELMKWET